MSRLATPRAQAAAQAPAWKAKTPEDRRPATSGFPGGRLSPAQLRALDLSRHLVVTASAGSGKTTVLVERFLKILESNGFKPEQVVAITFTEEAAAQMRQEISRAVEGRLADQTHPDSRWEHVYPLLSLARITTIHGFCLSVLRQYPLEAGLDPGFTLLSPAEQRLRLLGSVQNFLRRLSRQLDAQLGILLDSVPRSSLEPLFVQMLERRSYLESLQVGESPGGGPWFGPLRRRYREETAHRLLRLPAWAELGQILDELPEALLRTGDSCARRCGGQKELLLQKERLPARDFLRRFQRTLSTAVSPSRPWRGSPHYARLRTLWSSLKRELERYPLDFEAGETEERHFVAALGALKSVYDRLRQDYQREKSRDAVLDFEDLLIHTARLLARRDVCEALWRRYRFLLVDEFQDTNFLQWEILRRLVGPGTNLFAVGDAKQSIYRFRDADVTVFRELQCWMRERGRRLEMSENYRALPQLIEFNNRLFGSLFREGLDYEAAHQPMLSWRAPSSSPTEHCVEACFYQGEPASETLYEAEKVATRIVRLVQEEGIELSDVAILLRARTRLKEYEEALRRHRIPFQTVGGVGFYERQEVADLVNLLRFLADADNDVALLGILRSPFFNLSDEDLFLLSLVPGSTYWQKLENAGSDRRSWRFALECLSGWRNLWHRETLAGFLGRALRETGFMEILSASPRGAQNCGNVRKFMDLARAFEAERSRSLREFLRFVEALMEGEPGEAEATTAAHDPGQVVKIYTIHGAKGLQFPVVICPELGTPLLAGRKNLFHVHTLRTPGGPQTFLGLKIWNPGGNPPYQDLKHPVYRMCQRLDEYRQIAEEKRLLYVAATRARDRLILIGRRTSQLSYAAWIEEAFGGELKSFAFRESGGGEEARLFSSPATANPRPWPEGFPPLPRKLGWSATELVLFSRCPYRYYLSRIEGWREDGPGGPGREEEELLMGAAVHEILEKPLGGDKGLQVYLQAWEQRCRHSLAPEILEEMKRRIRAEVQRVTAHPFYERLRRAVRLYSEKPFSVRERDRVVTGSIDKLFQEADGGWVVVDFKTDRLSGLELSKKIAQEGYDLQVGIYLWAVSRILGREEVQGFLFFTHTGDVVSVPFDAALRSRCESLLAAAPQVLRLSSFPRTEVRESCFSCGFYRQRLCSGARPAGQQAEQRSLW